VDRFDILGPCRLVGSVAAARAKNAALPAMAASLLCDEELVLVDLPAVEDIRTMQRLLAHLGVAGENGAQRLTLRRVAEQTHDDARYELVKTMRASILVLGPLVARLGHARVSLPGGCAIGVRPIDQHLAGLEALGAEVALDHGYVTARASRLRGGRFRFETPTVTGTENLMMAASVAAGTTVLENCAREPEIEDLAALLEAMGGHVQGAGTPTITIEGVERLHGATHRVIPDRIECGTFLIGAALTGGDVTITDARPDHLHALLAVLEAAGCSVEADRETVRVRRQGPLGAHDVDTAPYPGFPTDLQAQYMALMTQAQGVSRIHETVFENRFQHAPELARMGARIEVDQAEATVAGPTRLAGAHVMATDLRASACLVLAALAAEGPTRVHRIYHLDRGYEAMEEKLRALGADVARIAE